jgi:hypothetical protein
MQSTNRLPTFEEYKTASRFERIRMKYGIFILIGCWICLIILIYFVWHYATELSMNPVSYMLKKLDINDCYCYGDNVIYYINRSAIVQSTPLFSPWNLTYSYSSAL